MFHDQWSLLRQNEEQKIFVHIYNLNPNIWVFDKDKDNISFHKITEPFQGDNGIALV